MSYADKVAAAFATSEKQDDRRRDDALEYLKALRDTWKDVSTSLNRTVFLMLGFAAAFELIVTGEGRQVNLAGFTFDDLATIQVALPVLVAYLYLEVMVYWMRYDDMHHIHVKVMRVVFPNVEANDLDLPLSPPSLALLRAGIVARFSLPLRSRWVSYPILLLVLPTLFDSTGV